MELLFIIISISVILMVGFLALIGIDELYQNMRWNKYLEKRNRRIEKLKELNKELE